MTLILHCIGVVTSIIIFPFGIMVLIFYFCGHKCSGNENTEGMERKGREIKLEYAGMKKIDEKWEESEFLTYFNSLGTIADISAHLFPTFRVRSGYICAIAIYVKFHAVPSFITWFITFVRVQPAQLHQARSYGCLWYVREFPHL